MKLNNKLITALAVVSYLLMVAVNYLANSLPINNRSTGMISDSYPNLFAPAGVTFSIWGLIYLLLASYLIYQFIPSQKKACKNNEQLLRKINLLFIATSIANFLWIFAWHYDFIGLSVIIMLALLIFLIKIADFIRVNKMSLNEKIFISTPFSVYFGWITIATIANITVFLVSIGWNGFGIPEFIWTSVILMVGLLIGILRMNKDKKVAYGFVLVWAYLGILLKHLSSDGFNGQYPSIVATLVVCLIIFGFFIGRLAYRK